MKIDYKLHCVAPNVYLVEVENQFDLAMLFMRAQEYYESPNPEFLNRPFDIWEYIRWYASKNGHSFTYGADWAGFNVPVSVIYECYDQLLTHHTSTPYDFIMLEILEQIYPGAYYLIGATELNGETQQHEICHALYRLNEDYQRQADELVDALPTEAFLRMVDNLKDQGYTDHVLKDEIQAYLMFGYDTRFFCEGLDMSFLEVKHNEFHQKLDKFF